MKKIMITAHSGCEGTPDNSMESILTGIELGADAIEIDIRMDRSGAMWLTHNEIENYEGVVPLEKALQTIAESGLAVNCDLKEEKLMYPVLEAVEAAGFSRDRIIFSGSVDITLLEQDPKIAERARIFLNVEQIFKYLFEEFPQSMEEAAAHFDSHIGVFAALLKRVGAECINPSYRLMPHSRIAAARFHGIQLSLWTPNDPIDQARLLHEDLVNITTRKVASAIRLRKEIRG